MSNEAGSIATMKRYYGNRLFVPVEGETTAEIAGGNDRSCIISVASLADAALEYLLAAHVPRIKTLDEKQFDYAFRFDGPMGAFSNRIELTHNFELIDDRLKSQLDSLRAMRNAVAHTRRPVTFKDKPLQNVAKRLFSPSGMFALQDNTPLGYRNTFIAEGLLIQAILIYGRPAAIEKVQDSPTAVWECPLPSNARMARSRTT